MSMHFLFFKNKKKLNLSDYLSILKAMPKLFNSDRIWTFFIEAKSPKIVLLFTVSQEPSGQYIFHQNQEGNQDNGIQYRRTTKRIPNTVVKPSPR